MKIHDYKASVCGAPIVTLWLSAMNKTSWERCFIPHKCTYKTLHMQCSTCTGLRIAGSPSPYVRRLFGLFVYSKGTCRLKWRSDAVESVDLLGICCEWIHVASSNAVPFIYPSFLSWRKSVPSHILQILLLNLTEPALHLYRPDHFMDFSHFLSAQFP